MTKHTPEPTGDAECAFCGSTKQQQHTWLSANTGLRYCIDEHIEACLAAYGERAYIEPMGVKR